MTFDGGNVTVETKGFKGKACQLETAEFERTLGAKTADRATAEAKLPDASNTLKAGA